MTHFEHYLTGEVFGIKYRFENAGDGLPWHAHDDKTAHNVIVIRGRVEFKSEACTLELSAGAIFDFEWDKFHEITALDPDTLILNVFLYGQPAEYEELPEHEIKGSFDRRELDPVRYGATLQ